MRDMGEAVRGGATIRGRRALVRKVLAWYAENRRRLPWRALPGARADPYHVWLSEIMLQQTQVATVEPYFRRFVARWPNIEALAAANLDEVLHAWAGLGYYARRRGGCARRLVTDHAGALPKTESELRALPGIGAYSAAAIAAIAHGRAATVVDGNVERVITRLFAIETPLPRAHPEIRAAAARLMHESESCGADPGDWAQALMELGALVCTPRRPGCARCPCANACTARARGNAEDLPRRVRRPKRPLYHAVAFWIARADGAVLLRRRPPRGLLGGMLEVPSTPWRAPTWTPAEARRHAPLAATWRTLPGTVDHGFTHLKVAFRVAAASTIDAGVGASGMWIAPADFRDHALARLTRKIADHALGATMERG
jgi:A/G-specific adenine glycosylase